MADASAQHPAPPPATVADVMRPPVTTVEQNDHVDGAAYLMKRAGATALVVTQAQTHEPIGIITEADISHLVADGKNPNDVRIYQLMTVRSHKLRRRSFRGGWRRGRGRCRSSRGRRRGRKRSRFGGLEGNTAQYPVNRRIVAGEPVVAKHHRATRVERGHVESDFLFFAGRKTDSEV